MIHRKKNRPALQRRDILTVSLVSFLFLFFFIGNLLSSSSTQFLVVPFLAICRAVLIYLVVFFSGLFLELSVFSDSVDFSYSEASFFLFFSGIFHASSTVFFSFLVLFFLAGLFCLLRMHAINSCVGDT